MRTRFFVPFLAGFLAFSLVQAEAVTFTPIPNTGYTAETALDGDYVAFRLQGLFGGVGLYAVHIPTGSRTTIADTTTPIPGTNGSLFTGFGRIDLSGQNVVFIGEGPAQGKTNAPFEGIYRFNLASRTLTKMVDVDDSVPEEEPDVKFGFFRDLAIDGDQVLFSTQKSNTRPGLNGVFLRPIGAGVQTIADENTRVIAGDIAGGTAFFQAFGDVAFEAGRAAFVVNTFKQLPFFQSDAVYVAEGGALEKIVDRDDALPGAPAPMTGYADVSLDGGKVLFRASNGSISPAYAGYFSSNLTGSQYTRVYDTTTPFPPTQETQPFLAALGGNRNFSDGLTLTVGPAGHIHLFQDGMIQEAPILLEGAVIGGKDVSDFAFARASRDGDRFVFAGRSADLSSSLYLGDLEVERPPLPNFFIRDLIIQQGVVGADKLLVERPLLVQVRPGVEYEGGDPLIRRRSPRVSAQLHVLNDAGLHIPGSPFRPTGVPLGRGLLSNSKQTLAMRGDGQAHHYPKYERQAGDDTLNFVIPHLPLFGDYKFHAEINPGGEVEESDLTDNRYPALDGLPREAVHTRPFRLLAVRYTRLGVPVSPLEKLFRAGDFLRQAWPLESNDAEVVVSNAVYTAAPILLAPLSAFLEIRTHLFLHNLNNPRRCDVIVGIGEPGALSSVINLLRGNDELGVSLLQVSSLAASPPEFFESTVTHEVGHLYGLGDTYETPTGLGERAVNPRLCPNRCTPAGNLLIPGGFNWFRGAFMGFESQINVDFMGGLPNDSTWTDLTNWNHLFDFFELGSKKGHRVLRPYKGMQQDFVWVGGVIETTEEGESGSILSTAVIPAEQGDVSMPPPPGPYALRFLDASEQELFAWSFPREPGCEGPCAVGSAAMFGFSLPFPAGTRFVDLETGGARLDRRESSTHAPAVTLLTPTGGETVSGMVPIAWEGSDQDGDALTYTVSLRDASQSSVLVSGVTETTYLWDSSAHAASTSARIEVIANDGFLTGSSLSGPLNLTGGEFPSVVISSPADGQWVPEDQPVVLSGSAFDPMGRATTYAWSLVGQGPIGEGALLVVPGFSPGLQVVRLTAHAGEDTGTAETTIEVYADVDRDLIPDEWEMDNDLDPADPNDAFEDDDLDGLSNGDEFRAGTSPQIEDTDGDGSSDFEEWVQGSDGDDAESTPVDAARERLDGNADGFVDGREVLGWQKDYRTEDPEQALLSPSDLTGDGAVDHHDGVRLVELARDRGEPPTPTPTMLGAPTPTPTATLDTPNTPTTTPSPSQTPSPTASPTESPTATTTPTRSTNFPEAFVAGDVFIDFSVFPNGDPMPGIQSGFTPGTYLTDQFDSVGVEFRSTLFSSQPLTGIGVGVVGGPTNNMIHGMRNAPPNGLDGRTVFEIVFDAPVQRAGVRRRSFINYTFANAVTRFYREDGALLMEYTTDADLLFVHHDAGAGQPGIKRVEITSTNPSSFGAGGIDDLLFSPLAGSPPPPALVFVP